MSTPVRIPADVDMPDRLIGPLTARQVAILAVTGLVLYTVWTLTRTVMPIPAFLALAIPLAASAAVLALGQRDGISLDRMLLAAIRQRITPRHRVATPDGVHPAPEWLSAQATATTTTCRAGNNRPAAAREAQISRSALRLPAEAVTDTGVIDLGSDGLALVAVASTVNFALRTSTEQENLIAGFGRYLHSLAAPVQILIRAHRLDLSTQITELRQGSVGLAHPALQTAALEHAEFLTHLREQNDLLRRQVLLIFREPAHAPAPADGLGGPSPWSVLTSLTRTTHRAETNRDRAGAGARRAAESRLVRRLGNAIELLAPAGIVVTALDAGQASAVLAAACNPDTLLPPCGWLAGAEEVITTPACSDLTGQDRHTRWRHDYSAGPDQAVEDDWDYHDEDGNDGWGRYR
ncbi:MAG: PrgI family protein [Pseudonocardiaceae bacterium]